MMKHLVWHTILVIGAVLFSEGHRGPSGLLAAEERPPNIVFLFIDDMGYADPSCFGNPHVKTPRIDELAEQGIKLTNFYVNSPICSPSRVAVTTGQYPGRWKIHSYLNTRAGNKSRGMSDYLAASAPTTAKKLKDHGYATAHFGKWHMGGGRDVDDAPLPTEYGFDESLVAFEGLGDRLLVNRKNSSTKLGHGKIEFCERWEKTEKYTDRAIDFIRRHKDQPFYVRLFPNDVHDAHVPWPGTDEKWKAVTDNPWEQKFFAVLEEMDKQLGRLIDEIDTLGLASNTLIVFTSDNGPTDWPKYYQQPGSYPPGFTGPFFGRKWSLYEGGIRMPFIARWPGKIPAGVTDETSVMCAIDLSPTLCHLAGATVPADEKLDGQNRADVLLGKPADREPIFWQYGAPHSVLRPGNSEFHTPSFAMRDGRWKLLINPDGSEAQLYDLVSDIGETTNLLTQKPGRAAQMLATLREWAKDVGYEFDETATPTPPSPKLSAKLNNQLVLFDNLGVQVDEQQAWVFDGEAYLDLPSFKAPPVGNSSSIRINLELKTEDRDGVILAHGGDKTGYAIYLKAGKLAFATCSDWKQTVIQSEVEVDSSTHQVEAFWDNKQNMHLKVDGKLVAKGESPSYLDAQPGDSIQVGRDRIKPVGDYADENPFHGTIRNLTIRYARR